MPQVMPLFDEKVAFEIGRAAAEADTPDIPFGSLESFVARVRRPWPGNTFEQLLATIDGVAVGYLELGLPQLDNLANVNVQLAVHPEHRRRGAGRALHAYAVDRTRALGRKHLIAPTMDRRPDGAAFATAMGATAGLVETRSRLDLSTIDADRLDSPAAGGYRLVQWVNVAPEEHLDDIAYLESRLNQDAPTGDLAWEPENVDADRIRAAEEAVLVRGRTAFHTGAVHEASGRLVAWTMIASQDDTAWHAWQSITIVDPGHRGHRLGLLIKIENLRYARRRRPELRVIDTFNAAENAHMLGINQAMGFRKVDAWTQWQLTV
jgi:GNAT superfamily N-acetyltransferase